MITSITIENFKGIRDRVKLDFRPITLLFGANSAGKSTILHALHYAREVFERHNLDADQTIAGGKYIDLGGFEHIVNRRDHDEVLHAQKQLRLRINVEVTTTDQSLFDVNFDLMSEQLELNPSHAGTAGRRCPAFDHLRMATTTFVLWYCEYDGPYIDYASRPEHRSIVIRWLQDTGAAAASCKP